MELDRRKKKDKGCDSKTSASSIFTFLDGGGGSSSSSAAAAAAADPIAPAADGPVGAAAQDPIAQVVTTTTMVNERKRIKKQIAAGQ